MIQRFATLTLLAVAAIALAPSAQAQQYFATRGGAQASCPGGQVIRQKPPTGTSVMDDPGDGSSAYGAYTCLGAARATTNNAMGAGTGIGTGLPAKQPN